jgi:hypothetical protein
VALVLMMLLADSQPAHGAGGGLPRHSTSVDLAAMAKAATQAATAAEQVLLFESRQQAHGVGSAVQEQGVLADGVSCVPVTWTEWDLKVKAVSALLVWRLRVT